MAMAFFYSWPAWLAAASSAGSCSYSLAVSAARLQLMLAGWPAKPTLALAGSWRKASKASQAAKSRRTSWPSGHRRRCKARSSAMRQWLSWPIKAAGWPRSGYSAMQ